MKDETEDTIADSADIQIWKLLESRALAKHVWSSGFTLQKPKNQPVSQPISQPASQPAN